MQIMNIAAMWTEAFHTDSLDTRKPDVFWKSWNTIKQPIKE